MEATTPTILIVEDDLFLSAMYAEKLSLEGFLVVTALDGETGVAQAERCQPNLILLDIMLPKQNGFEVLQAIRAKPELASVPVIMLTNLNQPEQVKQAQALGATDYLVKAHFIPAEVVERIKHYLPQGRF